jgi:hypothetical protein
VNRIITGLICAFFIFLIFLISKLVGLIEYPWWIILLPIYLNITILVCGTMFFYIGRGNDIRENKTEKL